MVSQRSRSAGADVKQGYFLPKLTIPARHDVGSRPPRPSAEGSVSACLRPELLAWRLQALLCRLPTSRARALWLTRNRWFRRSTTPAYYFHETTRKVNYCQRKCFVLVFVGPHHECISLELTEKERDGSLCVYEIYNYDCDAQLILTFYSDFVISLEKMGEK